MTRKRFIKLLMSDKNIRVSRNDAVDIANHVRKDYGEYEGHIDDSLKAHHISQGLKKLRQGITFTGYGMIYKDNLDAWIKEAKEK